ncbi:MAG: hypothetical protein M1483_06380 [Actinobacteria bacterium]|nr:hypothetical protein [Actinomycetota bacterium]MCL6105232.1 hypothetical protein [Actinomycetota bacterium]
MISIDCHNSKSGLRSKSDFGPDDLKVRFATFTKAGLESNFEGGFETPEALIAITALLAVVMLFIQMALWGYAYYVAQAGVQTGDATARDSWQYTNSLTGSLQAGVEGTQAFLTQHGSTLLNNTTVKAQVLQNNQIRLSVVGKAESIFPGVSLPIHASSIGPLQLYRSSG